MSTLVDLIKNRRQRRQAARDPFNNPNNIAAVAKVNDYLQVSPPSLYAQRAMPVDMLYSPIGRPEVQQPAPIEVIDNSKNLQQQKDAYLQSLRDKRYAGYDAAAKKIGLSTREDVKKKQQELIKAGLLQQGGDDGLWGNKSQEAYALYLEDQKKKNKQESTPNTESAKAVANKPENGSATLSKSGVVKQAVNRAVKDPFTKPNLAHPSGRLTNDEWLELDNAQQRRMEEAGRQYIKMTTPTVEQERKAIDWYNGIHNVPQQPTLWDNIPVFDPRYAASPIQHYLIKQRGQNDSYIIRTPIRDIYTRNYGN